MLYAKNVPIKEKNFILELHDVTPLFSGEFAAMQRLAKEMGAVEPVFLWTPRWAGRKSNEGDRKFGKRFGSLTGEIVLHGYSHHSPGTYRDKILYGEPVGSEFKHLKKEKAYDLIKKGKTMLENWSGKPVNWFCAPRWHYGKGTIAALHELGFTGYFKKNRVVFLEGGAVPVPVLSFDNGAREVIDGVNRMLRKRLVKKLLSRPGLFRLALHPRDMRNPGILGEIKQICNRLKNEGWRPVPLDKSRCL
ncbi:MAG: DUF2334 domain-containing protein [Candidatus Aminicenantes bacterium]|nr:DUF2334 domain-containing protein [Candidatus Aminicenantes bacterium]